MTAREIILEGLAMICDRETDGLLVMRALEVQKRLKEGTLQLVENEWRTKAQMESERPQQALVKGCG